MSREPIGKRRWAIAEGYIPGTSTGCSATIRVEVERQSG